MYSQGLWAKRLFIGWRQPARPLKNNDTFMPQRQFVTGHGPVASIRDECDEAAQVQQTQLELSEQLLKLQLQ